ncbi:catechol 1,2-dioxygenase [Pseudarthrobacter sulfonivorans]|uniref:Catechol 1,2-dioxygenase n=1 Tax=Pseudarthrobacter sulfonivorans TaxID=121292 RepID=A0A0U3QSU7_9MICC|nr:VOC family protein [Pseudarthrobacter sulfonivorans]ALV42693.1 catechol 1,2-dioxygenase [Pseudarthrobacter sulfonivorans]
MAIASSPGPRIAHVGAISLGTPDLETSLNFFRDLLGMEEVQRVGDTVYLRGYQELKHHSLVLFASEKPIVDSYSFRVGRPEDVELYAQELKEQDIEVLELPRGHQAGRGTAIRFMTPYSDHPFEFYYDIDAPEAPEEIRSKLPSNSSRRRGLGVRRIDHYNVQTAPQNVAPAEKWLRETLDFKRREYVHVPEADMLIASWLSVTPQVHDLAIAMSPEEKNGQLHHVAFNLENHSDLLVAADVLRDHDVVFDVGPAKHGIAQSMYLYLRDPGSGHRVELYAGGYQILDPDWKALEWTPLNMDYGATWFGDPLPMGPDGSMYSSTDSASLTSLLGEGLTIG